jgi:5'(3')-deoxyribonucleotidase
MSKPRILLDVDEVVADFIGFYVSVAEKILNRKYDRDKITEWHLPTALELPVWANREIDYTLSRSGTASKIPIIAGAQEAVEQLAEFGEVVFVTAPFANSRTWASDRVEWLRANFGKNGEKVIVTDYKTPVCGEIFVDDKLDNLKPWYAEHGKTAVIWDCPHNRYENPVGLQRTNKWGDLISLVKCLSDKS